MIVHVILTPHRWGASLSEITPPPLSPCILLGFSPFADVLRHSWAEWGGVTKDICLKAQQNRPYKGLNLALSILTPEC